MGETCNEYVLLKKKKEENMEMPPLQYPSHQIGEANTSLPQQN